MPENERRDFESWHIDELVSQLEHAHGGHANSDGSDSDIIKYIYSSRSKKIWLHFIYPFQVGGHFVLKGIVNGGELLGNIVYVFYKAPEMGGQAAYYLAKNLHIRPKH